MPKKIDLNEFLEWQREKKGRHVSIKMGDVEDMNRLDIWVYDYEIMAGQIVSSANQIDIEQHSLNMKREEYEKLKAIFEKEKDVSSE